MFVTNLIDLLEKNNISLAELSRRTDVPKSNLSSWLKGRSPNLEQLDKVAQYFGTTIEHLAFGRKSKESESVLIYRLEIENGRYEIIIKKLTY